jgi:hypothetical protein
LRNGRFYRTGYIGRHEQNPIRRRGQGNTQKARAAPKERLSLYPLNLETALVAAMATGPVAVENCKLKQKKQAHS